MNSPQNISHRKKELLMNIISQEARQKQAVVKYALRKGKSEASRKYGVSLSSVKRWCKRYDGKTWQSLLPQSHTPHSHPKRHTRTEEKKIRNSFKKKFKRYGSTAPSTKACLINFITVELEEFLIFRQTVSESLLINKSGIESWKKESMLEWNI